MSNLYKRGIPYPKKQEQHTLALSDVAGPYGCCGVFDLCGGDDLVSLSLARFNGFLDWLGWETTDLCKIQKNFIDRTIPSEEVRQGWLASACDAPNSINWAACDFIIEDFGRLRRAGPTQDVTKNHLRLCEAQPRYRRDGTLIVDDLEWYLVMNAEVMLQDLMLMVINGNVNTAGQFDGLENLVTTGYVNSRGQRCSLMDSITVDWNFNGLGGGAGVVWTDGRGARSVSATATFTDLLRSIVRVVRTRIRNSGLGVMDLQVGDVAILATSQMAECILDQFTCWRVCPGLAFNESNLNTLEARTFRDNIEGGSINANGNAIQVEGFVNLHGLDVPVLSYDWGLATGSHSDVYVLTGSVGGRKVLHGQYNDMSQVQVRYENAGKFFSTDGGKVLGYFEDDETCLRPTSEIQPRIISWAPWTNTRITNVACDTPGGEIFADPTSSSFIGGSSFSIATCVD